MDGFVSGRFAPIAALLVDHDASASLTPHALRSNQIGSVMALTTHQDMP